MKLSVFVMTFNEVASLPAVVEEISDQVATVMGGAEVVIVDDGSTDGSSECADALVASTPGVRVVHHGVNRGLGGVYRTGFAEARGDLVTFYPADGQFPASTMLEMLPFMDDTDMVLGYLPAGGRPLLSRALSAVERLLYHAVLGPLPRFQGVLMFRRDLLAQHPLRSSGRGWAVLMEFIIRVSRGGHRVRSVPTRIRDRMSGRSKVNNLRTIVSNTKQLLEMRRLL
jgi:glycosyltransferase involved in cell wall biosynthesis